MIYDPQLVSNGNPMEAIVGIGDVRARSRQCIEIIKAAPGSVRR